MVGNHVIEHRAARIAGLVGRKSWRHTSTLRTASRGWRGRERCLTILHICTVVKKKLQRGEGRPKKAGQALGAAFAMALAARHSQRAALQAQAAGHRGAAASKRCGSGGALPQTPEQKYRCRVGREVTRPGPSPDPDKEISTIRLFHRCGSWLYVATTFTSSGDML